MKFKKEWVIIILLLGALILQQQCNNRKKCPTTPGQITKTDTTYIYDTVYKSLAAKTLKIKDSFPYEVPVNVDTAAILAKYYTQYNYEREFSDSNIDIKLFTSIQENRITKDSLKYKWKRPTTMIVNNILPDKKERSKVFIGGFVGGGKEELDMGVSLAYLPKTDDFMYSYSYDPFGGQHRLGVSWKIKLKK
jgi:hypothetical protein